MSGKAKKKAAKKAKKQAVKNKAPALKTSPLLATITTVTTVTTRTGAGAGEQEHSDSASTASVSASASASGTDRSTSAHKVKPDSGKTPQKPTSEPQQAKQQPAQERVRPEGMTRRQWKNVKNMRRVLAFWPELFDLDNPKPLKVGVLDDLMQDISARNLAIGAGVLRGVLASYTRRIRYQKALAAGGARYDLNGQPCGEVTPEQQQTQQTQQEAADALRKAKDKQEGESAKDG
ncbi:ProQ/FinO family protein [Salmonella enterica]